jgi:hypothetical protein
MQIHIITSEAGAVLRAYTSKARAAADLRLLTDAGLAGCKLGEIEVIEDDAPAGPAAVKPRARRGSVREALLAALAGMPCTLDDLERITECDRSSLANAANALRKAGRLRFDTATSAYALAVADRKDAAE